MADARVTVVVINWRLKEATLRCLRSVQQLEPACHVIVVDNGSGDSSAEFLARHFPHGELLVLPENVGFGTACNYAITSALRSTACAYVLLLNNDAVIDSRALSELLRVAQEQPAAGILGPKIFCSEQPDQIWYAGARRRHTVLAAADTGRGDLDQGQYDLLREVDYVFGAAMLIRREVFEQIGLFDQQFFMYLEDMDLCLRAQAAGFKLLFVPRAHVWHEGSASTRSNQALGTYYKARSMVHFLRKHTSPGTRLAVLLFWMLVWLRDVMFDLVRGDVAVVRSSWLGLMDGLTQERRL